MTDGRTRPPSIDHIWPSQPSERVGVLRRRDSAQAAPAIAASAQAGCTPAWASDHAARLPAAAAPRPPPNQRQGRPPLPHTLTAGALCTA